MCAKIWCTNFQPSSCYKKSGLTKLEALYTATVLQAYTVVLCFELYFLQYSSEKCQSWQESL